MCSVYECNFEGVAFQDLGMRENGKTVYQLVCKYHKEK